MNGRDGVCEVDDIGRRGKRTYEGELDSAAVAGCRGAVVGERFAAVGEPGSGCFGGGG